jgi:hypothetical protein
MKEFFATPDSILERQYGNRKTYKILDGRMNAQMGIFLYTEINSRNAVRLIPSNYCIV